MMKKSWTLISDSVTTELLLHESVRSIDKIKTPNFILLFKFHQVCFFDRIIFFKAAYN